MKSTKKKKNEARKALKNRESARRNTRKRATSDRRESQLSSKFKAMIQLSILKLKMKMTLVLKS
jgi:hypothetical protein